MAAAAAVIYFGLYYLANRQDSRRIEIHIEMIYS
jgi:hypothetical protein